MTKLRKCWAWLDKTFNLQYFWLSSCMCQLKGYGGSQQISLSWGFAEMIKISKISFTMTFIIVMCWFKLVLSNFQKTEILLRRVLNTRFHCRHFWLLVCYDSGLFTAISECWEEFWTHIFSFLATFIIDLYWF